MIKDIVALFDQFFCLELLKYVQGIEPCVAQVGMRRYYIKHWIARRVLRGLETETIVFKKWANPGIFFVLFSFFSNTNLTEKM